MHTSDFSSAVQQYVDSPSQVRAIFRGARRSAGLLMAIVALTSVNPYLPEMIESFGVPQDEVAKWVCPARSATAGGHTSLKTNTNVSHTGWHHSCRLLRRPMLHELLLATSCRPHRTQIRRSPVSDMRNGEHFILRFFKELDLGNSRKKFLGSFEWQCWNCTDHGCVDIAGKMKRRHC